MNTKSKRLRISLAICAVISVTALTKNLAGSSTNEEIVTPLTVRPIKTQQLDAAHNRESRSFPGIVKANKEVKLSFRVGGPLILLNVKAGQLVKKGEIIAKIDPRDFTVQVNKLKASILEARANLKVMEKGARQEDLIQLNARLRSAGAEFREAALNLSRYTKLVEQGAVSRSVFDRARAAHDMSKARVDEAEQALEKARKGARVEDVDAMKARIMALDSDLAAAKNALDDTTLTAPFQGFIHEKTVENHETIVPGQIILSLLDTKFLKVNASIPESMFIKKDAIISVRCEFEAWPGQSFDATIDSIGRKTSTANQSYPMALIIRQPSAITVTPGMAATISLELKKGSSSHLYSLPVTSVFSDSFGKSNIWVLDKSSMTVKGCPVRIDTIKADKIFFTSSLSYDTRIVTAGAKFLREGQKVKLIEGTKG